MEYFGYVQITVCARLKGKETMSEELQEETLEVDDVLEKIIFYCIDEAKAKIDVGEDCTPFTVVVDGEQMFVESHPGDDVEACRNSALHTVKSSSTFASHYAFCYDGFLMTDNGQYDAVIVECAEANMEQAHVIALLYQENGEDVQYEEQPVFVDSTESFFDAAAVKAAQEEKKRDKLEEDELLRHLKGDSE